MHYLPKRSSKNFQLAPHDVVQHWTLSFNHLKSIRSHWKLEETTAVHFVLVAWSEMMPKLRRISPKIQTTHTINHDKFDSMRNRNAATRIFLAPMKSKIELFSNSYTWHLVHAFGHVHCNKKQMFNKKQHVIPATNVLARISHFAADGQGSCI